MLAPQTDDAPFKRQAGAEGREKQGRFPATRFWGPVLTACAVRVWDLGTFQV